MWGKYTALYLNPKIMKIISAKPEVKSLFFINLTGTLLARYPVPFYSVIDT